MGVTLVPLAQQFLGVTVTREVESSGLHFEFDKPERLFWAVWILWGRSLVCYLQQVNSMRIFSRYPRDRQTETQVSLYMRWIRYLVTRNVRTSFNRQVAKGNRIQVLFENQHIDTFNKLQCVVHGYTLLWRNQPEDPMAASLLDDVGIRDGWFQEHTGDALDKEGNRLRGGKVWVPQKLVEELRWPWVFAVLWTCAATSFVTDYLAPVAIGLLQRRMLNW